MSFAYSPVNKNQYNIITKKLASSTPPPIKRITGGSALTDDIYLIPFISEERYKDGYPALSSKIEWTFDFGEINAEDIFIIDSQWDPKTLAFFATCLWDSPNYTGTPLIDNGWKKGSFSPSGGDFYTHKNSIELGYFQNSFSPRSTQFFCADFSKIKFSDFKKTKSTGAYEMSRNNFIAKYKDLLCNKPLDGCCSALPTAKSYPIKLSSTSKKNDADKITNFNPSTDTLEIDTDSFGIDNSATFAIGKNKKKVKRNLAKQDFDFLYDQKKGGLYFNENGPDKGFGDGGIIAILKGAPDMTANNVEFI